MLVRVLTGGKTPAEAEIWKHTHTHAQGKYTEDMNNAWVLTSYGTNTVRLHSPGLSAQVVFRFRVSLSSVLTPGFILRVSPWQQGEFGHEEGFRETRLNEDFAA